MSARVCTECGAAAADDAAEHCASCGALLEARKLHVDSDVRVEHERLDAALPHDPSLPAERWGRVSDHPAPRQDEPSAELVAVAAAVSTDATFVRAEKATAAAPTATAHEADPTASRTTGSHAAMTPSAELSSLLINDISVAVASRTTTAQGAAHEARSTNTTGSHPAQQRRPPVLASEALQRDLAPARPARSALRVWSPLLGTLGAAAVWYLTDGHGMGLPLAGAFGGLALLGLPPMPYVGRAAAVVTVAATGLALVLWGDAEAPRGLPAALLTLSVGLLASGLYLRAWHRASLIARLTVTAGVLTGATFLWMSGDVADLTLIDTAWQSWLPRLVGLSFGILLMLSLLTFMDARSTGGSIVWATFLIGWQAVHAAVETLRAAWPKLASGPDFSQLPLHTLLAAVSTPLLTALLAVGLAQLMAAGLAIMPSQGGDSLRPDSARPGHEFAPAADGRVPPHLR